MNEFKGAAMKPLVLALSATVLALALAACGGGGAESAGPAPSVSLEAAPPATSPGDATEKLYGFAPVDEYVAQADAICKAATDKLEAALRELKDAGGLAAGDLAFRISGDALAELRALTPPDVQAVNPVALCSHRSGTREDSNGPMRAEYIAQARPICSAAMDRWGMGNLNQPESALEAARIEEEALARLRALPQPEADRALLEEAFYSVVAYEIDALRGYAAAAAAGDTTRALLLGLERVHLTHQRGLFTSWYGLGWCPVDLPA
jgi:hypothetical protein